ncbi:MAG: RNA-guided endonuclease IscB, partial [Acidiferrobacter sp.]
MAVLVMDRRKRPLMPCSEKRARLLLERGRARVHPVMPFTIRLVDRYQENAILQTVRLKLDPGSQTTGLALVREQDTTDTTTGEVVRTLTVLMLLELQHRGSVIRDRLTARRAFRQRRRGNVRYRPARFDNRTKPEGWLSPSLRHRVDTTRTWVARLRRLAPVTSLSQALVRFDTQQMQNPEVSAIEYQQGTLAGY